MGLITLFIRGCLKKSLTEVRIVQHYNLTFSLDGGIGRRAGLKIQFFQRSEGSTPSPGTKRGCV